MASPLPNDLEHAVLEALEYNLRAAVVALLAGLPDPDPRKPRTRSCLVFSELRRSPGLHRLNVTKLAVLNVIANFTVFVTIARTDIVHGVRWLHDPLTESYLAMKPKLVLIAMDLSLSSQIDGEDGPGAPIERF